MKKIILGIYALVFLLISLWTVKCALQLQLEKEPEQAVLQTGAAVLAETGYPAEAPAEVPTEAPTEAPTEPVTEVPTEAATEVPTEPVYVYSFTPEEEQLLLKLGMAERGENDCVDCIALVMRTVLNRVEGPKFASNIRNVIYTQDQFTPAMEGTLEKAVPNPLCYDALEMIKTGWDESQGALYYEWCEGDSWHRRSLNLLFQHCDVRFYK